MDVVAARSGDDAIEVAILGSREHSANLRELEKRLRDWRAANPAAEARIETG